MSQPAGCATTEPILFQDLQAQRHRLGGRIDQAIARVLDHGRFIMGPEVVELESKLAAFANVRHCVTCANGTDALQLALMAKGIGPGDAVFVPAFTFVASAEAPALLGATPVFVDVLEDTFTMDSASLSAAIDKVRRMGLKPAAVMPVDLFGQPADYGAIGEIAREHGLFLLADGAQSFGATLANKRVGSLGDATATSFFPAKPLGCYGDGGAVFTDSDTLAQTLRSIRMHGQGVDKYDNVRLGLNSRLDTMQAAVLIEKLSIFEEEIAARNHVAHRYTAGLADPVRLPVVAQEATSVWAQYTIRHDRRDALAASLKAAGVATAVYYPIPLNRQGGYRRYPVAPGGVPVSERLAAEVISLPMHPYLAADAQTRVIDAIHAATCRPCAA
ncbi:DegT/DnrJ/EryC1/StrS family aminotransferase [Azospirillum agricola]|uniref:DegT/DnrJ/EryC1/StrS family aminotransferase n=1 Tax=Azospirillum agricola TaxID=1720247 RepID=UPI000A0F3F21|nr:DegT/DnrJ/EryC1/StrS family aminotransferase [Azospirillum agricola]SMH41545.1 dTDP-4-amino-4,6-dideoxygalactose transaminase [Azospirillum lipoferum]